MVTKIFLSLLFFVCNSAFGSDFDTIRISENTNERLHGASVAVVYVIEQGNGEEYYLITPKIDRSNEQSDVFLDTTENEIGVDPQGSSYKLFKIFASMGEPLRKYFGVSFLSPKHLLIPSPKTVVNKINSLNKYCPNCLVSFSLVDGLLSEQEYLDAVLLGAVPMATQGRLMHHDINFHLLGSIFAETSEVESSLDKLRMLTLFQEFVLSDQLKISERNRGKLNNAIQRMISRALQYFDVSVGQKDYLQYQLAKQTKKWGQQNEVIELLDEYYEEAIRISYLSSNKVTGYWDFAEDENNQTRMPLQAKKDVVAYMEQVNNSFFNKRSAVDVFTTIHKTLLVFLLKKIMLDEFLNTNASKSEEFSLSRKEFEHSLFSSLNYQNEALEKFAPNIDQIIQKIIDQFLISLKEKQRFFYLSPYEVPIFKNFSDTLGRLTMIKQVIENNFQTALIEEDLRVELARTELSINAD